MGYSFWMIGLAPEVCLLRFSGIMTYIFNRIMPNLSHIFILISCRMIFTHFTHRPIMIKTGCHPKKLPTSPLTPSKTRRSFVFVTGDLIHQNKMPQINCVADSIYGIWIILCTWTLPRLWMSVILHFESFTRPNYSKGLLKQCHFICR